MSKPEKYTPTSAEEEYFLALESILRWTNRQGYPADKIRAIRKVASQALLRDEYERAKKMPKTWTPNYLRIVGAEMPDLRGNIDKKLLDASTDDHGTPVPQVMKKIIDKYTPNGGNNNA